jgi:hypothetical protein
MRLNVVYNNSKQKKLFNCATQAASSTRAQKNKGFKTIDELLIFAMEQNTDTMVTSITPEIFDYIKKINHSILRVKNFMLC